MISLQIGAPEAKELEQFLQLSGEAAPASLHTGIAAYDNDQLIGVGGWMESAEASLYVLIHPEYSQRGVEKHMRKLLAYQQQVN